MYYVFYNLKDKVDFILVNTKGDMFRGFFNKEIMQLSRCHIREDARILLLLDNKISLNLYDDIFDIDDVKGLKCEDYNGKYRKVAGIYIRTKE